MKLDALPARISGFGFGRGLVATLAIAPLVLFAPRASAQPRPYLGYVYPAGGQRGTNVQIRIGGQNFDDVIGVEISGTGARAGVVEALRRLNNQELQLLNEQLKELKRATSSVASTVTPMMKTDAAMMSSEMTMMASGSASETNGAASAASAPQMIARIEKRVREFVQTPATESIASLVIAEVSLTSDAEPGERELRLITAKGVSNPLVFCVGQLPEYARAPLLTSPKQILGKEEQALRKRPASEVEDRVTLPCTLNGQIASGEVNRYRFTARQGQRLVFTTQARELIPFIADAVPGWFQPVLALYDAQGREVSYDDDYRFNPDPTIFYQVPRDGEYVLAIYDSIYRGRVDFVYRVTAGELPFLTSLFPLGRPADAAVAPKLTGWNLRDASAVAPDPDVVPGREWLAARRNGFVSNRLPFELDSLPETLEKEPNDTPAAAQHINLPVIVNGRINKPGDWDVFAFTGHSNDEIVAEVTARRLDSPLDSVLELTDAKGHALAFNDDCEDLGSGVITHQADSYFLARLPADGTYYVRLGDTTGHGGEEYGYRLRVSAPLPDFELRVVPSSVSLRPNSTATLTVYAQRKDGFTGPIRLALENPPAGFSAFPVTLASTQTMARVNFKGPAKPSDQPARLSIEGRAKIGDREIVRPAVPAEDRMQAFLWRHLVPAGDLQVLVFDPGYQPPAKRAPPEVPPLATASSGLTAANTAAGTNAASALKAKFSKQQIATRLRQLKLLYQDGLLTDPFYCAKVAECETAQ